jgi:hypothetical protein
LAALVNPNATLLFCHAAIAYAPDLTREPVVKLSERNAASGSRLTRALPINQSV